MAVAVGRMEALLLAQRRRRVMTRKDGDGGNSSIVAVEASATSPTVARVISGAWGDEGKWTRRNEGKRRDAADCSTFR